MQSQSTYRLPAFMALLLGGAGLFVTWQGYQGSTAMIPIGLGVVAVALLFLFTFVVAASAKPRAAKPRAKNVPTPNPTSAEAPTGELNFEYDDVPEKPAIDNIPTSIDMPDAFAQPRGTVVTTDPRAATPPRSFGQPIRAAPEPSSHAQLTQKYTSGAPMVREILMEPGLENIPEFQAQIADPMQHPSMLPPDTVRGKCGQCETMLLAPTMRPIKLACPSCRRTTLLEG